MTTVEVVSRDPDPGTGQARVVLLFREPHGLRSVTLFSRDGVELTAIERPEGCPNEHVVVSPWLLPARFPLQAEALSCGSAGIAPHLTTREELGPIAPELAMVPGTPGPISPGGCSATRCPPSESAECIDALAEANRIAGEMQPVCEECERLQDELNEHESIRAASYTIFLFASAVVVAAGLFVAWPANVILAAIFGAIALAALIVSLWAEGQVARFQRALDRCNEQLATLRTGYADATSTVLSSCCCFTLVDAPC